MDQVSVPTSELFLLLGELQLWKCFCNADACSFPLEFTTDVTNFHSLLRRSSKGTSSALDRDGTVGLFRGFPNFLAMLSLRTERLVSELEIMDLPARAGLWLNSA